MIFDAIIDFRAEQRVAVPPRAFCISEHRLFTPEGGLQTTSSLHQHLLEHGIPIDFADPLILDIEGQRKKNLFDPVKRYAQIREYRAALDLVRSVRRFAMRGCYGLPEVPWSIDWRDSRAVAAWWASQSCLKALAKHIDIVCPVYYWRWLDGNESDICRPMADYEAMVEASAGMLNTRTSLPIHGLIMGMVHGNAPADIAKTPFPASQMAAMASIVERHTDGPIYWGRLADDSAPEHIGGVLSNFEFARAAVGQ